MLEALTIKGFRKYRDFTVDGFGKINFILGDNNIVVGVPDTMNFS